MNKRMFLTLLLLISLSFITFWRILFFDLWIDDQKLLWASLYHIPSSFPYYNHPGLPLTFLVLSRLFGETYILWQIFGIVLKAIVSYLVGIFVFILTQSKRAGFLSSVFFAVSYVGLETIAAPIMNISAVVAIPMLLSLITFLISIAGRKQLFILSVVFFLLSIALDPGRMFSYILVLPLFLSLYPSSIQIKKINPLFLRGLLILSIIALPLFVYWFWSFVSHSQIVIGLTGLISDPLVYIPKVNRLLNLFAAVGNVFIGLGIQMHQNEQNTGEYRTLFGLTGLLICVIGLMMYVYSYLRHSRTLRIIAVCMLWTYIFYIPNWFSEPRAPMAAPHRYLFLTNIGYVALLGYVLSLFKRHSVIILCSVYIVFLNINKSQQLLIRQSSFRHRDVINAIWNVIESETPHTSERFIFVFTGEEPWLHQSVELFGSERFALRNNITNPNILPLVTNNQQIIVQELCRTPRDTSLSRLFSWRIVGPANVISETEQVRRLYQSLLQTSPCSSTHIVI